MKGKKQEWAREKFNCDKAPRFNRSHFYAKGPSEVFHDGWKRLGFPTLKSLNYQMRAPLGGLWPQGRLRFSAEADLKGADSWRLCWLCFSSKGLFGYCISVHCICSFCAYIFAHILRINYRSRIAALENGHLKNFQYLLPNYLQERVYHFLPPIIGDFIP